MFRVGGEGAWNGGPVENGLAHVDGDGAIGVHYGDNETGEGVDVVGFGYHDFLIGCWLAVLGYCSMTMENQ